MVSIKQAGGSQLQKVKETKMTNEIQIRSNTKQFDNEYHQAFPSRKEAGLIAPKTFFSDSKSVLFLC